MEWLERYGYLALVVVVLLEGVGIPTPAVTVVVASAAYAATGQENLATVVALTLAAAVAGDNLGYLLGRYAGRRVVLRWGRYVGLTEARLGRAEDFFRRRGGNIVIVARFVDGLRQTNGLISGTIDMPWRLYVLRDGLGAMLWTALWVSVGAFAGGNLDRVSAAVRRYQIAAAAVAALVLVGAVAWWWWRRRRRAASPD